MARIYKRGGVWWCDIHISGNRVRRPLDSDKREAESKLAELIKQRRESKYGTAIRDISWPTFKERYFESRGAMAPDTTRRDRASVLALERFSPLQKLSEITPELLSRWVGVRRGKGIGPATINRDLCSIKAMMRTAESWKYVDPQAWISVKRLKQARGKLLFYTVHELGELLAVCQGVWQTIVMLGARAGLRRGEMYHLEWGDVDFSRQRLHVCPKSDWSPKDYEARFIPMPDDLRAYLQALKRAQEGRWVLGKDRPTLGAMSVYFRRLSRKAKLKGNIHTLRHTYASHLVQAGVPILTVSKLLGHSSVEQTEIYAHLAEETLSGAVARLPRIVAQ